MTDAFGPLGNKQSAGAQEELAKHLVAQGYEVTVLFLGEISQGLVSQYASQGIVLEKLPETGFSLAGNEKVRKSYDIYQALYTRAHFSTVYFTDGLGYHTIKAQKQGLVSMNTRFVVMLDALTESELHQIENGPESYLTDVEALKSDYFLQRSAELAVLFFGLLLGPSSSY